jgi:predicted ATPase
MRIKTIQLRNGYKRFKDLTIDLGDNPAKIVALVGPNGSGKSSVFDGMLYVQSKYSHIGARAISEWKYHSMNSDPSFDTRWQENVVINFDTGTFAEVFQQKNSNKAGKTMFSFRSPYRYSSQLDIGTLKKVGDIKENNIGAGATVHLDDKVTDNYQRLYSLIDRKYKARGSALTYEQVKEDVLGDLNKSLNNVLDIVISDHGDILDGRGTLYFKKTDQENEFDFNVLSSGEKEVVDILVDIFIKKEDFQDSIYLIDEPELHINTNIQRSLLNEIVNIIPDSCQIWIATHSIGFLNSLKQDHKDNSAVIWFTSDLVSKKSVVQPMIKNRKNWKIVFETALVDLTGLVSPETIVYCEGRKDPGEGGEEQGFDAEFYNSVFESEFPDTLFVSSGGSTEPDKYSEVALKVLNKAFDSVRLLLLKDKDINSDGSMTTDEDREKWLSEDPLNRRMLIRKELENYIYDLEIIKKFKPDINEEEYNKMINDIKDGDLKSKGVFLKKLCGREQISEIQFKRELIPYISKETSVYLELKSLIFSQ